MPSSPNWDDFILEVKGVDLADYGFAPGTLQGLWDSPSIAFDEVNRTSRDGTTRTELEPTVAPRDAHVTGTLFADTETNLELNRRKFLYQLSHFDVAIRLGNHPDLEIIGTLSGRVTATPIRDTADGFSSLDVDFTLHCENPIWREVTPSTLSGSANTDVAIPLGSYRSWGVVSLTGTDPVLTYKHHDGTTLHTLGLAGTGAFVVDMDNQQVTLDGDPANDAVVSGDFFDFDPRDGDWVADEFPTLRATAAWSAVIPKAYP